MNFNKPKWVVLQLLEGCNLRCRMCYEWGENGSYKSENKSAMLDSDVACRVIEDISDEKTHYDLFGGEPLLYPDLEKVLRAIKKNGGDVDIPTNGTLLEEKAEMFIDVGVDRLWVSLDGPPHVNDAQRGQGVFERAIRGVDKLYALRQAKDKEFPKIGISTVVTPTNYHHLLEFYTQSLDMNKIELLSIELQTYVTQKNYEDYKEILRTSFGVEKADIIRGSVRDRKEFEDIDAEELYTTIQTVKQFCVDRGIFLNTYPASLEADSIRKYFSARWDEIPGCKSICPFPVMEAEINAKGDVTSCHAMYDLVLGNVYDQDILSIWNGEAYRKYRKFMRQNKLMPVCPACCLFYNEKPKGQY